MKAQFETVLAEARQERKEMKDRLLEDSKAQSETMLAGFEERLEGITQQLTERIASVEKRSVEQAEEIAHIMRHIRSRGLHSLRHPRPRYQGEGQPTGGVHGIKRREGQGTVQESAEGETKAFKDSPSRKRTGTDPAQAATTYYDRVSQLDSTTVAERGVKHVSGTALKRASNAV